MSALPLVREAIIINTADRKVATILSDDLIDIDEMDTFGINTKGFDRSPLYPTHALIIGKWYKGYVPEVIALSDSTFVLVFHKDK